MRFACLSCRSICPFHSFIRRCFVSCFCALLQVSFAALCQPAVFDFRWRKGEHKFNPLMPFFFLQVVVNQTIAWIQARAAEQRGNPTNPRPFFAYQGMNIVHPPYVTNQYWYTARSTSQRSRCLVGRRLINSTLVTSRSVPRIRSMPRLSFWPLFSLGVGTLIAHLCKGCCGRFLSASSSC